jgi:hypothetical protein
MRTIIRKQNTKRVGKQWRKNGNEKITNGRSEKIKICKKIIEIK